MRKRHEERRSSFAKRGQKSGAVGDTIQIREKTKRSFRSKELGELRSRVEKLNDSAAVSAQGLLETATAFGDHI